MLAKDLRAKVRKECKRLHVNESDFATRLENISTFVPILFTQSSKVSVAISQRFFVWFHSRMDRGATPRFQKLRGNVLSTKAVDESLEGGAGVKALTQQLQRLDGVVAERVDAVLATRGRFTFP